MYKIEENDPNEPTTLDREAAEKALKPFCLHASVDLVEHVALAIKSERTRVEARQNQELAELRERYPDALFQAEDLLRQVKSLESKLERTEFACREAMRKADDHRRQRDELKAQLCARHDELGFDASRAETAELERDRAKAEAQRAQQELQILKDACRLDLEDSLRTVKERISAALKEIS